MSNLILTKFKKLVLAGTGQMRTHQMNGINYQVFPVVMLVHGVHQGIGTDPVYYSPQVLQADYSAWNDVPVTIQHPVDNEGEPLLASDDQTTDEVIRNWGVGMVRNTHFDFENERLMADVYLDPARAEALSPGLLEFLNNGGQLEVSTGLLSRDDNVSGVWRSERYSASVLEIVPDHLALLPGGRGACSWDDGCGVRVNQGTGKEEKTVPPLFVCNEVELGDRMEKVRSYVDSLDVFNEQDERYMVIHFTRAVYNDYFIYKKADRRGEQESTAYIRQGYSMDENGNVILVGDPVEVIEEVRYTPKTNQETNAKTNSTQGGVNMADKNGKTCCPKKVAAIITNSGTFTEADREWLEGQEEAQLDKLVGMINTEESGLPATSTATEMPPVKSLSTEEVTVESYLASAPPAIRSLFNSALKELDNKRAAAIARILAAPGNAFAEQQLKDMDMNTLESIVGLIPAEEPVRQQVPVYAGTSPAAIHNTNGEAEEPYTPRTLGAAFAPKKD